MGSAALDGESLTWSVEDSGDQAYEQYRDFCGAYSESTETAALGGSLSAGGDVTCGGYIGAGSTVDVWEITMDDDDVA